LGGPSPQRHVAKTERGMGLSDLMVIIFGLTLATLAVQKISKSNLQSTSSLARLQDLEMLKITVQDSLNCERTVGLTAQPSSPVPCRGPYVLRRADGRDLIPAGSSWLASARCVNDVLVISVESKEPDPLLKKKVTRSDLFEGASVLCNRIFTSASLCERNEKLRGYLNGAPLCSQVTVGATAGFYWTKTDHNTDGPRCIIANEYSKTCSCPLGSRVVHRTSTSLYRQWTATVFCGWDT
jgi:hypothetical protein